MRWSVGITTIPNRRDNTLLTTLLSLREAGFITPHLFVDGDSDSQSWRDQFGLDVSSRHPKLGVYGNWIHGLWELFIRHPLADMYAMFQDDLIAYKNLRSYLERVKYPGQGYLNLYTHKDNQSLMPVDKSGQYIHGFWPSNQRGFGALGLVFNRECLVKLLTCELTATKVISSIKPKTSVDGLVVEALSGRLSGPKGWKEYVHSPSLIQHIGTESSIGHYPEYAPCFLGENYDAMLLLNTSANSSLLPANVSPVPPPSPPIHPMRHKASVGMNRYNE